ncbi:MAG: nitronate monooxygenase [Proteobacteria bacterium]|nr:nitronate monooxygenase [Pseudomonadota bacterium]
MRSTKKLLNMLEIDIPIVQAPMAGASSVELVAAVSNAGGLGSYGCSRLSPAEVIDLAANIRAHTNRSFNLNFFCHAPVLATAEAQAAWRARLSPYYAELGIASDGAPAPARAPFDEAMCDAVVAAAPKLASFHFGVPAERLLARVKGAGCVVASSATTVAEARRLVDLGCDIVVAQGLEAGGHRGMFLDMDIGAQVGTFALVPQVVDAVNVPVIAAGAISDARGAAAAFALGADAIQPGTAYLLCPEIKLGASHRAALASAREHVTMLTNVFTGRPARAFVNRLVREVGPMSDVAPAFPFAANAVAVLARAGETRGSGDFTSMWAGQAAALAREMGAGELTRGLVADAFARLGKLAAGAPAAGAKR